MTRKERRKTIYQAFFIILGVVLFGIILFVFLITETSAYKFKQLDYIRKMQQINTHSVKSEFLSGLNSGINEVDVMENTLLDYDISSAKYYILLKNDGIVYDHNRNTSEQSAGISYLSVLKQYEKNSGSTAAMINHLNQRIDGASSFNKSYEEDSILAYVAFFQLEDDEYSLISCIDEAAALIELGSRQYITVMVSGCIVIYAIVLLFMFLFLFVKGKKAGQEQKLLSEIKNKNNLLQQITQQDELRKKKLAFSQIYDAVTGLYDNDFFFTVIEKIKNHSKVYDNSHKRTLDQINCNSSTSRNNPEFHKVYKVTLVFDPVNAVSWTNEDENVLLVIIAQLLKENSKKYMLATKLEQRSYAFISSQQSYETLYQFSAGLITAVEEESAMEKHPLTGSFKLSALN